MKLDRQDAALGARIRAAATQALVAAATVPANAVRLRLRGGYTSGRFVTGLSSASVTQSAPESSGDAVLVRVGTNVKYAPFWEFGHFNVFTRKYERVEVWRPGFLDSIPEAQRTFRQVFFAAMGGATTGAPNVDVRPPAPAPPVAYSAAVTVLGWRTPRGH